jgi:glycosyltransferase involved in cell wall biosynthesis
MFETPFREKKPDIIIVADFYARDIMGGAELTTQALIDSCPDNINLAALYSRDITIELMQKYKDSYWIFTNFSGMNLNLIPTAAANLDYSVIEYDYKFCKYRSIEKHRHIENTSCNCHEEIHGKLISAFYLGAKNLWWMSEAQEQRYVDRFPFLAESESVVLSSVFDDKFFIEVSKLNKEDRDRSGWLVLDSNSWIKGTDDAIKHCQDNNLSFEKLSGLSHSEVLEKLSAAEGLVYLPKGGDTCPRLVIEAKMLGCKLVLNEYVQHKDEIWFNTEDPFDTNAYLFASRERFWNSIISKMNWSPSISGYTTVYNCDENEYPWEKSIESMLGFCDEVVVVDGGSTDGTWEKLNSMSKSEPRLVIEQNAIDWDHPRFAYHSDGMQKAYARSKCTSEFCWQMDSDEFILPEDYEKVINLVKRFPKLTELVALPVVEFWGGYDKVRVDVNPWKWRVSKNSPYITHGIPLELRREDENGNLYTAPGSDTCDYIHKENYKRIKFIAFYSEEIETHRRNALSGNLESLSKYEEWFNTAAKSVPTVYHMSWFDLERKIKLYKNYWSKFWQSQYNTPQEDTPENNMFFNKKWSEVNSDEIKSLALKLKTEMGGWVFHNKVDWEAKTPHIHVNHTCKEFLEK